jgi:hypothetical protein
MTIYILIAALYTGHGPAITTQEFLTKQSCEAAAEVVRNNFQGYFVTVKTECVPK